MSRDDAMTFFTDEQAAQYDSKFAKLSPLRDALHLLAGAVLAELPPTARVLSVGAGTGAEILALASRFPQWSFVAVEPSSAMLDVCRRRLAESGLQDRCQYHMGFLDSLPPCEPFDAATSLLVSHFLVDADERADFFRDIAARLRLGGWLINADLASPTDGGPELQDVWFRLMRLGDMTPDQIAGMRQAYDSHVALLSPQQLHALIQSVGFTAPRQFLQTGLIHASCARRGATPSASHARSTANRQRRPEAE